MNQKSEPIPVNRPLFGGNEAQYLRDCIESGWISSEGAYVSKFEEGCAKQCGRRFGIAVSSGSAALEIAFRLLRLRPGDEVILPAFTIISCYLAVVRAGGTPVFVDSEPDSWNMNLSKVRERVTSRTKAVLAVHTYGLPVDIAELESFCQEKGLHLVEDAAEVQGQCHNRRACGSFGAVSTLSFYANKVVACGEGGMVLTDSAELAAEARALRNLCFQPERRFVHEELGYNFRMTNMQAAVGLAQLEQLEGHLARKRQLGGMYQSLLRDCQLIELPLEKTAFAENMYWVFGVVLKDSAKKSPEQVVSELRDKGVATRPFFWPLHLQPVYKGDRFNLPVSERLGRRGFYLPSGTGTTFEEIERSALALKEVLTV